MPIVTLTAADGETLTGRLPDSWGQVPLAAYATLATADTFPNRIRATAALVGLPAQPLLDDVSLYGAITRAAPWLFGGALPEAGEPLASFTHQGTTYRHVGNLDKINGEQFEALTNFLREAEGKPLTAAPGLLAVLYCAKGKPQTAEAVAAAQAAFATLPVATAWPALAFFLSSTGPVSLRIQTVSALSGQAEVALATLEQALATPGAFTTCWQRARRWLASRWLRSARKMLGTSSNL
jgi:hypothetical protein